MKKGEKYINSAGVLIEVIDVQYDQATKQEIVHYKFIEGRGHVFSRPAFLANRWIKDDFS